MKKKKIIILYSTAGMGHKKAAFALLDAFKEKKDEVSCEMIDVLEYGNRFYNFLYKDFYVFMMSRAKAAWGILYDLSNLPVVNMLTRRLREVTDFYSLRRLEKAILESDPDAIIATHFLFPSISRILRKNKCIRSQMYAVVTDYGPHSFWLSNHINGYFVGSESALTEMVKRKIPAENITATGIPVTKEFNESFNTDKLRKTYGLDKSKKTVLLLSGGYGVGPMEEILFSLNDCSADIQVITVCGHNEAAYEDIQKIKSELKYPVILFGFTDKVAELMAVSDLMITKAGGISVTEAMNARLPMILFASVPGQETWNEKMLCAARAAEKAKKVKDIPVIANRILLSDDVYEALKEGIDKVRKPDAAERIVDKVMGDI